MTEPPREQLRAVGIVKGFTLHNQGGLELPVLSGIDLPLAAGNKYIGPSGVGKSTLLRALRRYGAAGPYPGPPSRPGGGQRRRRRAWCSTCGGGR
jgi:ABC-type protease/lipase transport system fused ATPase/permease subunit